MQMNNTALFELMERNLAGLSLRMPDVPIQSVMMCRLILHLGREMAAMFEQRIRPSGLNEAEFRVLSTLYSQANGTAHPSDLCAGASQSPANMSRISDALVSRDLITRVLSVHDRRRMVLRITEQGEELVRELLPKMWRPLKTMMKSFPESEQRDMVALLKRVGLMLDEANTQAAVEQTA
jgi:MarR family transcriptional regulator, negative regulator of the multidrug operon emrRAB